MTGASKILTVSYGTFSCTLEGFDEPFNTMKAIAEYFRDLAAEDRYFGAEPPTPDAAMLHRIAEREIHRRVEAKIQDNGVILRAGDALGDAELPAPSVQPALADATIAADSVTARLSKLRGTAAPLAQPLAEAYHEDQDASDLIANLAAATTPADQAEAVLDDLIAAEISAQIAPESDGALDESETASDDLHDQDLVADSADASQIDTDDQDEDFADHATEADWAQADALVIENVDQETQDDRALDGQAADDALLASLGTLIDPDDQEYLEDDQDVAQTDLYAKAAVIEPVAEPTATVEDQPLEPGKLQRARARVIKIRRADAPPLTADQPPVVAPTAAIGLLSPEAEAALQAELAALEAELAPQDAPGIDEAALAADLAEPLAEAPEPAVARPTRPVRPMRAVTTIAEQALAETVAEPRKRIEGSDADDAVNRLMAQTNTVMGGAEIIRRQSAIAHLKAAVVATEADRQVMPQQPKPDRIDPYRTDLESVVRPARSDMAAADRPSPLVLVSAQRIARTPAPVEDAPRIVAPVRPRRVAAFAEAVALQDDDLDDDAFETDAAEAANLFSDAESFGDFAERLGAVELPDMLEAAAVYCAQVLGRPQFSRPMVLSQLASLPEAAHFSREDGLRVFGTLMRQGRIAKIKHGQFAVTDRSPILAEAMRSAG